MAEHWMMVTDSTYDLLLAMFEMWGIEGVAFIDSDDAVAWIEEVDAGRYSGDLPTIAILELRLPGRLSGDDVAVRIRQSPRLHNIAIVLASAAKLSVAEEQRIMERAKADSLVYMPLAEVRRHEKILR